MIDYRNWDATATAQAIKAGQITPFEAVKAAIDQVERLNKEYNAVSFLYKEEALSQAKKMTDFSAPFAGVPILLKDAGQDYADHPSTLSSSLLKDHLAAVNSHFVDDIIRAGFIIIGHTNAPEFALKFISDSHYRGTVPNPRNRKYHAGGSSGGAATALGLGMVPIAAASDGGGSIRIPASFSGLIGLKPSRGRTASGPASYRSWAGAAIDFALTQSVRDTANFLMAMQSQAHDAMPFRLPALSQDELITAKQGVKDLRIAYTTDNFIDDALSQASIQAVEITAQHLKAAGFNVEKVHLLIPGDDLIRGYYVMNAVEQSKTFHQLGQARGQQIKRGEVEDTAYLLAEYGKHIPAWEYSQVFDQWDHLAAKFQAFHENYDLLLQPATAKAAPKIGQTTIREDLLAQCKDFSVMGREELEELILKALLPGTYYAPYAYIYNLTGQPAISLPLHKTKAGLPFGLMFSAQREREADLLAIADYLERHNYFINDYSI